MKTNVKLSVLGRVLDTDKGVMYNSTVASGIEANLTDLRDKLGGLITGAQPFANASGTHKIIIPLTPLMVSGTFQDKVTQYLEEGITILVTHKRHHRLKIWLELETPEQYVIAHIRESDTFGNYRTMMLKELPRG